jgi:hypothetical protein
MHSCFETNKEEFTKTEVEEIVKAMEVSANNIINDLAHREKVATRIAMISLIVATISTMTIFLRLG